MDGGAEPSEDAAVIDSVRQALPLLLRYRQFTWDYDKEADVLYLTFERAEASDSDFTDDDIVVRHTEDGKIIGLTVLHASRRNGANLRAD
jgi:uncharacterized protein YuzE